MKGLSLYIVLLSIALNGFGQIGLNNPDPDSSAVLDIKSTDRGILIPRMTSAQRLAMDIATPSPVEGLMVFDTDQEKFYFWNADESKWYALNPFDYSNQNLVESNVLALNSTKLGIGTESPENQVSVNGNMSVGSTYAGSNAAPLNGLLVEGKVGVNTNSPTENLHVNGNTLITGNVTTTIIEGCGSVPLGGILMWNTTSIPAGFVVCNGNGGSAINGIDIPDLQGRFLVSTGKSTDGTTTYARTNTGGEQTHTLIDDEMKSHNHGTSGGGGSHSHAYHGYYNINEYGCAGCNSGRQGKSRGEITSDPADYGGEPAGAHSHTVTSQGGDDEHENRPPYYAVYYIIRVQ